MNHEDALDDAYATAAATYREAAAYVASFLAYVDQHGDGTPLDVETVAAGLTDEDRRALR
jgi:hypothetical protein